MGSYRIRQGYRRGLSHSAAPAFEGPAETGAGGLLVSEQGTNGGYRLARDAERISALEVIRTIDGPIILTQCFTEHANTWNATRASCARCASRCARCTKES